jgi:DNA modification methylase
MQLIDLTALRVGDRQRTIVPDNIRNLEESIASKGLLHAPVAVADADGFRLIAGEHRMIAITNLHKAGREVRYNGDLVPDGRVPIVSLADLSPADLLETELEENVVRAEIPWQDRTRAIAAIHDLRKEANPKQTFTATAKELAAKQGNRSTEHVSDIRTAVRNATILAANLHRPSVQKARNATEALGILLKEENARLEAALIQRKTVAAEADTSRPSAPPQIVVHHGSLVDIMPTLDDGTVDLICADLPYGIDAHKGGFRNRTVEHHNYDDSFQNAKALMQATIVEGFRVAKPRANLFIFGDVDLFAFFKEASSRMGWKPFRTPIIWQKSESEGLAPWGREGFRRTYELIFFATKGGRGLLQSPTDVLRENRVSRALRRYGPEKPVGLMEQLIECSTMPGDMVLDPCCGSGSTLAAARRLKRKAIGIELDEGAYNLSLVAAVRDETPAESSDDLA